MSEVADVRTTPLRRVLAVLALFVAGGAGGGVLWERLWQAPTGLAFEGRWYLEPAGPDVSFQAIALFVVISFPLGLVLALLSGMWRGHETATLVSVVVGAGVAAFVMYAVGHALGPGDPQVLAAGQPDYTPLPADLGLTAPDPGRVAWHSSALLALPAGAMTGLVATYLLGSRGLERRPRG
ncbi:hypothetical protein GCM10011376_18060 [Nocardioides flavus (ex Wang et al. 2016)]|uniref:DUF2567 domain-containing protein n=1 Tax=Nocardioides flavus (ex Wang et al. 2016) TaxID=2058780 RepID=A0ABQ3HIT4_9ACTN|nr:hypothetical protein [Nocardioides flavus (ex Wang et al. 2016)]GHE17196.1 hypothetical protein GCM10011376_18060 [Nocardioides flavus (ex Wang et al. 2016)]